MRNLSRALERLPEKLNESFEEAIERIESQSSEYASLVRRVISWIFYAKRPLKIFELQEALAVEPGDLHLDRSGVHDPGLLTNICCGLVSIDEKTFAVRLVHHSFQEFLNIFWEEAIPHAEIEVGSTYLTYPSFDDVAIPGRSLESAVAS